VILTSAERVLVHLHGQWNAREPKREMTQAGIAEGAQILRSHVPRALKVLLEEGLVEMREARLLGRARKSAVYLLTPAGMAHARELVDAIDVQSVDVDGRTTTLGEARKELGLTPLEATAAVDDQGRLVGHAPPMEKQDLLQRDEDLGFLRRWRSGTAPIAVVYGSRGMGKTALGRAFARTVARSLWIELRPSEPIETFAAALGQALAAEIEDPRNADSVAEALAALSERGVRLAIIDGYGDVPEGVVDVFRAFLQNVGTHPGPKVLVLAQETTPAYCRFYGREETRKGLVVERHLKGLDPDGCRRMLGNPGMHEEDLQRIYLLTRGCPLYLQYIREGDEYGLRQNSRFTKAEIRLLLFSGRAAP
jgi:hypothetical protein